MAWLIRTGVSARLGVGGKRGSLLAFLLFAGIVPAVSVRAELPRSPAGYVTDRASVIESKTREKLEMYLSEVEAKTSAEVAVVTLTTLDGRDVADVANELFSAWGIGKKGRDNGVLFLIAPTERKMRIEVGYGLEAVIPDAAAGRILDASALPLFRAGDISGGIAAATVDIGERIANDAGVTLDGRGLPRPEKRGLRGGIANVLVLLLFVIVFLRHPWLWFFLPWGGRRGRYHGGGFGGGGFGGGFGGFGGGMSGGGGASRGW